MDLCSIKASNQETGESVYCVLSHGLDLGRNVQADISWMQKNAELLESIAERANNEEEMLELLSKCQLEDKGWRWIDKGMFLNSGEYEWFYLCSDHEVEAICVLYHPKDSRIDNQQICYVDFLAVAPWNRSNPVFKKRYSGFGSVILKQALTFAQAELGYRPGFSLHSLPQAEDYYTKLGMRNFGRDENKENLIFFEMDKATTQSFLQ